jgi:PDZ domain
MNKNQIIPIYIFITLSIISIITGGIIPTISNFDTQAFAYTPVARKPLCYTHNGIQSSSIGSGLHVSTTNSFYYPLTSSCMHQQYNEYYYGLSSSTSSNSSANRNDFRKIAEQKQHTANNSRTSVNSNIETVLPLSNSEAKTVGAWTPNQMSLQNMTVPEQQNAIATLLKQGFNEYYFVMKDFKSDDSRKMTENLLKSADSTSLKIIILILPPSESGPKGNFDWKGWIKYFNALKDNHSSFDGFAIDDFNWINTKSSHDKFRNNVDYMIHSHLSKALENKKKDVHFYPVMYFEGFKTNTAKRYYTNFADGLILASTDYYNVTTLEHDLKIFSKVFNNIPIRYVVYTTPTSTYFEQGYGMPSDRLVTATLSIARRAADGIIIWRNIERDAVQNYAVNSSSPRFLSYASSIERLQLKEENDTVSHMLPRIIGNNTKSNSDKDNTNDHHQPTPTPPRVLLGLSGITLDPDLAQSMDLPKHYKGVAVKSVIRGEPAFKAGIRGESRDIDTKGNLIVHGDVIIAIDGHKVKQTQDIVKRIAHKSPGDLLKVSINRGGQIVDLIATLNQPPPPSY